MSGTSADSVTGQCESPDGSGRLALAWPAARWPGLSAPASSHAYRNPTQAHEPHFPTSLQVRSVAVPLRGRASSQKHGPVLGIKSGTLLKTRTVGTHCFRCSTTAKARQHQQSICTGRQVATPLMSGVATSCTFCETKPYSPGCHCIPSCSETTRTVCRSSIMAARALGASVIGQTETFGSMQHRYAKH